MNYLHIPSTASGKTWRAYVYKPQGRPAYASATEGVKTETSFTTMLGFGDPATSSRSLKAPVVGRATDKAKRAALTSLVSALAANGFISASDKAAADETILTADSWEV